MACALAVCWPLIALAGEHIPGPIEAEVLYVVDGDTLKVRAHVWPGQAVETLVRVAGIDAPELHASCDRERDLALRAKARAESLAGRQVHLADIRFDKYGGRVVAQVLADGRDLGGTLLAEGLARAYYGKRKRPWCRIGE